MEKLKKRLPLFLVFIFFCLFSSVSFADAYDDLVTPETVDYFEGFYLGAGAGAVYLNAANAVKDHIQTGHSIIFSINKNVDKGNYSEAGKILLGYGRVLCQDFYAGGELFFDYAPVVIDSEFANKQISDPNLTFIDLNEKKKMSYSYGALIRGG